MSLTTSFDLARQGDSNSRGETPPDCNPAQWPGYATAAVNSAKLVVVMNMTVDFWQLVL